MSVEKAPLHLLIVDDCELTCQLLTALLTGEGYRVTVAHDGMGGLTAARNQPPDLAIVDLHLPDLSGIELAGFLYPEIPFLALTIDQSPEAIQACIEKGALSYLVKPLEAEDFLRQVRVALERGREQRNLRRALQNNQTISKALGVLMGYFYLSEGQAFKSLTTYASARNERAFQVAERILEAIAQMKGVKSVSYRVRSESQSRRDPMREAIAFLDNFRI
ncbi:MAG: response regulator [Candidatus Competibacteraceae bacterium]|nr:response regulator [Candidatus Competibacteraceae bacterium]